ncbi:MAG: hypothetical protein Q7T18_02180 [Sedimentisphaerales bacterium]|nr:hypothetical protein [Sedimentisphaerales bacterium]
MPIEEDFDPQLAVHMRDELVQYQGKCHYDEARKKIVYHTHQHAMEAYLAIQREEIERHKWIESEKRHHDMGREALADWICKFSDKFARYWRRTHVYIPPAEKSPDSQIK